MWKRIVCLIFILAGVISINAQWESRDKTKKRNIKNPRKILPKDTYEIKLGEKLVRIKGKMFNEILYKSATSESKYVAYQYIDEINKSLVITEISYDYENDLAVATQIETYICPLTKIDKKNSYNIEMENEDVLGKKYFRLTLLSLGQGIDNQYFEKQTNSMYLDRIETKFVNNLTINMSKKDDAENWLKQFTK